MKFATSANETINDCIIAGLKCSWNNWFGIPRLVGNAGGRVITSLACSRVCNVWKHNARRILCFWRSSSLQHVRDIRRWISNYVFASVTCFRSDHWPWIYVVSAVSAVRLLSAFVLNARCSRHGGLFRQKPGGDVDVVHMWYICGTYSMWYICGTYVAHMWHGHKNQRRKHIGPFKLCTFGSRCSIRVENENWRTCEFKQGVVSR